MNNIYTKTNADDFVSFDAIADDKLREVSDERKRLRAVRRAWAVNGVVAAREHAGRGGEPFTQSDADVIMAIMELLDRVAEL